MDWQYSPSLKHINMFPGVMLPLGFGVSLSQKKSSEPGTQKHIHPINFTFSKDKGFNTRQKGIIYHIDKTEPTSNKGSLDIC